LNPAAGGLDVTCAALRVVGAISNMVSDKYKVRYQALKDRLEMFDQMELHGMNNEIARQT
jgi:hypothetical protein